MNIFNQKNIISKIALLVIVIFLLLKFNHTDKILEAFNINKLPQGNMDCDCKITNHLTKYQIMADKVKCKTYSSKDICEKSKDACTWMGDHCDYFNKNPFPQPSKVRI
jgi:hypothetical protein